MCGRRNVWYEEWQSVRSGPVGVWRNVTGEAAGVRGWRAVCASITLSAQVDISPLELAIETVENKNKEIATLTTAALENVAFNLQSLTMILSGVIDAAVNGGIDNYRKVCRLCSSPHLTARLVHHEALS